MFGTIRKHQTWLWVVIIAVMIVSLVIFFNPTSDTGPRNRAGGLGSIDGERITRTDYANAQREAMLEHFLNTGEWPGPRSEFNVERETYIRLFFLKKLKDFNIHVDDEAVAQAANAFLTRAGGGRPVPLQDFVERALMPNATEQDFARYIRHYLGLQQLFSVVGLPGDLVTPQEARALYIRQNQPMSAQVLFYSGTNYQTSVAEPNPEALLDFYTNRAYLYELPERVQVHYVAYPASNYLARADEEIAGITNYTALIDQEHQQRGTNAFPDAKTPEEAKQKLREDDRRQRALVFAYRDAERFMDELLSREHPPTSEEFVASARTNNLNVATTPPFDAENGPQGLDAGPNFAPAAFRLTTEEPMADRPLVGEESIFVIALAKQLPVELQPYEVVKDRVLADFRRNRAIENARRAGTEFARLLQTETAAGKSFSNIVAEAGLRPIAVPALALSTTNAPQLEDHVALPQFKQVAFSTEPGKVSEFVPTAEGGFIVFVEQLLPVDTAKLEAELPAFMEMFRRARRRDAIDAWVQSEGSKSLRDTPLMQQQQGPAGAGGGRS